MNNDIPLNWFLYFAAASFAIGLVGVMLRRNAIALLMAIEIILNAANVNLVAFWRYGTPTPAPASASGPLPGVVLAVLVITVAAAEVAVGIGLILLCYRRWRVADVDRYDTMSG